MSEMLGKKHDKVHKLKNLILRLHDGEDETNIKAEFVADFKYVSGSEIAKMEKQLVEEGMDVNEIMRLCDIHASLFQDNLEELPSNSTADHPFDYFREDNAALATFMKANKPTITLAYVNELYDKVDAHYGKKEQLLFPLLEHMDIKTIPQVMWGVDNEIREELRNVQAALIEQGDSETLYNAVQQKIQDMITKENNVLYQMLEEHLSQELWDKLDNAIKQNEAIDLDAAAQTIFDGYVTLPSGKVTLLELEKLLNALPFDITFVDKNDKVAYVSQGIHRVFDRPLTVLGREVRLCHPPQSVHIVEAILADFKAKRKDHEYFWIKFKGMYVYIQYFAIYDDQEEYLGVVEVSQDIQGIQNITGEKRLLDETS